MRRSLVAYVRLYIVQAWCAYRALFAWSTPFSYVVSKFGFPFFSMLLFVFIAKFAGLSNPAYIIIGNILMLPATNGLSGISMTVGNERQFGAMSYLLGSPAPRAPIFLGRGLFHILDSFITVSVALPAAAFLLHVDTSHSNIPLMLACVLITACTTSGMGFILGGVSLISRDGWMITTTLSLALYVLVGANFPVEALPAPVRAVSYALPMTRGILAGRAALAGADLASVMPLLLGEVAMGVLYIGLGYGLFRMLERRSMISGALDKL